MSLLGKHAGGKYMRAEDLPGDGMENAIRVEITNVTEANVARQDQNAEYKAVLEFKGDWKPMVMNATNLKTLIKNFGTENEKLIIGKSISIYCKPDVEYQGELVKGLRLIPETNHAEPIKDPPPKVPQGGQVRTPEGSADEPDDDIPF